MKKAVLFVIAFILLALVIGCKTKYIPVESVKKEYIDKYLHDSIYVHDSIFIEKNGDSIFIYKLKYEYKDKTKYDSIFVHDSIPVPYPVIEYKEVNKITGWQNFQIWCGRILMIVIGFYFGIRYIRKK
jgi:hypothetical protein